MAAPPQPVWGPPPTAPRWGAGRVIALVIGILLMFPALGLIVGGGALLWADQGVRDGNGYLNSTEESFSSSGYAISSTSVDLSTGAAWLPVSSALGTTRIEVTGTGSSSDVFVGIARVADTSAYLDGVERTVVTDLGTGSAADRQVAGQAPSGPPGSEDFWTAQASGPGTQTLTWEPADGNWVLVVMNSDAAAGVSIDARIGATVPALGGLAWGVLAGGLFLLLIAALVLFLATRRRPAPAVPYGTGMPVPAGPPPPPPPGWTPPAPVDRTTAADARTETPTIPRSRGRRPAERGTARRPGERYIRGRALVRDRQPTIMASFLRRGP